MKKLFISILIILVGVLSSCKKEKEVEPLTSGFEFYELKKMTTYINDTIVSNTDSIYTLKITLDENYQDYLLAKFNNNEIKMVRETNLYKYSNYTLHMSKSKTITYTNNNKRIVYIFE